MASPMVGASSPGRGYRSATSVGSPTRGLSASHTVGSPHHSFHASQSQRHSSQAFAQQIRQLEDEGTRLLNATASLGSAILRNKGPAKISSEFVTSPQRGATSPSSLSALADITAEQNTISQLSAQLDAQAQETERFHRQLTSDGAHLHVPSSTTVPKYNSPLSSLNLPSALDMVTTAGNGGAFEYAPKSQVERELKAAKDEMNDLRDRLREAIRISEQQKEHFRNTIEDLKSRLHEALVGRDTVLQARDKETVEQEALVGRLQSTVEQLQQTNRAQEQAIVDMNTKMEALQKDQYISESALNQIRSVLLDKEQRRGKPYYEAEPIIKQNIAMMVHTLERSFQEYEAEIERKQFRIEHLTAELDEMKTFAQEKHQQLMQEHKDRLSHLSEEHETQVRMASERASSARQQLTSITEQLKALQDQTEKQVKAKDEHVKELEERLSQRRQDHEHDRKLWKDKQAALEQGLDAVQRDLTGMRSERDEATRARAAVESRFEDVQGSMTKMEMELERERNQVQKLMNQCEVARETSDQLQAQLQTKTKEMEQIQEMLKTIRQEYELQLQHTVANLEKEGKERQTEQLDQLTSQLTSMMEKYKQTLADFDRTRGQLLDLQQKNQALEERSGQYQMDLETTISKKDTMSALLEDRQADVDRLKQERDYYFDLLEKRNEELSEVKRREEKLQIQLEERDKSVTSLEQQHGSLTQMVEMNNAATNDMKAEREKLLKFHTEKTVEVEELKHAQEALQQKLNVKERCVKDLEEEISKVLGEKEKQTAVFEGITKEKSSLMNELKESRFDVAHLTEERDRLQRLVEEREGDLGKEISKLTARLKAAEHDLRLARKTMKTQEAVDEKAVKVAGKMQREVTEKRSEIDSLHSKLHWLEECLEAAVKDKKVLMEENEKLATAVKQTAVQNERLTHEQEDYLLRNKDLQSQASRLEGALEKAAVKNAACQAQLEQYEQDMARLKLKHQLELKEVERSGHVTKMTPLVPVKKPDLKVTSAVSSKTVQQPRAIQKPRSPAQTLEADDPVSQKPSQARTFEVDAEGGPVGQELRKLLDEMRSLISGQQALGTGSMGDVNQYGITQTAVDSCTPTHSEAEGLAYIQEPYVAVSKGTHRHSPSHSRHKSRSSKRSRHPVTSSYTKKSGSKSRSTKYASYSPEPRIRDQSPVSNLLTSGHTESLETLQTGTISSLTGGSTGNGAPAVNHYASGKVYNLPADTQQLCQRLEKKIENLSRMGGHLEQENKDLAALMRDQGKKLKKVRQTERSIQRMIPN